MLIIPSAAKVINHASVIGPNNFPTAAVPYFWIRNNATRIMSEIGIMNLCKPGVAISIPSTADRTEIAGVITDSPKSMHAPSMPMVIKKK